MCEFPRKSDGRRVFSPEFKRETVQRILSGEKTIAELSREFDVSPTVIRNWKRRFESGAATALKANEDVVPASELQAAQAKIRELERALGRKTMEVEILRAAQEILKKVRRCAEGPVGDGAPGGSDLPHTSDGAANGLSCSTSSGRWILPQTRGRDRSSADPFGDEKSSASRSKVLRRRRKRQRRASLPTAIHALTGSGHKYLRRSGFWSSRRENYEVTSRWIGAPAPNFGSEATFVFLIKDDPGHKDLGFRDKSS